MPVEIAFSELSRVYIRVNVKPYSDTVMLPIRFKVDTGSDVSTISKWALYSLGYDLNWITENIVLFDDSEKPTTAVGIKVDAGNLRLPLINLLGYEGKGWPFHVILQEDHDFRNLLGRDLLAGFNYSFNNDEAIFKIARAGRFRFIFPLLSGQEVNEVSYLF